MLLLLLVTRPLPRDGGMAEDHGAPDFYYIAFSVGEIATIFDHKF